MEGLFRCRCGVKILGVQGDMCRECQAQLYPDTGIIFKENVSSLDIIIEDMSENLDKIVQES